MNFDLFQCKDNSKIEIGGWANVKAKGGLSLLYEVCAISQHLGEEAKTGHWIVHCRQGFDGFWAFDDHHEPRKSIKSELLQGQMFYYRLVPTK